MSRNINQWDIYWVDLTTITDRYKSRPCLIVSNNHLCSNSSHVTIVPLTSNTRKMYIEDMYISSTKSKASFTTFFTVPKKIINDYAGSLNDTEIKLAKLKMRVTFDIR